MFLELTPVVRYWEFTAAELQKRLEQLRDQGCQSVAAWVPWSHLESDRHHLLQKMVRHSFALGMRVKLGVTPELGIGYWNNGLPEDLLKERHALAQDRTGQAIYNCAPPNIHPLLSMSAPSVFQRYGHFLLKLTQELTEILYEIPDGSLTFVISDSLFKHYHTTGLPPEDHGDFSIRFLAQGGGGSSQSTNPSGAESIFINRAKDFLKSRFQKYKGVVVIDQKVFSRSASLDRLLIELARSSANLPVMFREMTAARAHSQLVWLDDLFGLSEKERNFLISAALISYQQVWLSEDVWKQCSQVFRRRIANLIEGFSQEAAQQFQPACIFVTNRFAPARLAQTLRTKLGARLCFQTLPNGSFAETFPAKKLIIAEEGLTLEFQQYLELAALTKIQACTVMLFKSSLCERALRDLASQKKFNVARGWKYDIIMQPSGGQMIFVEGEETTLSPMDELADSAIAVAQLKSWCQLDRTSQEIYSISIDWPETESEIVKTLFLLNPSSQSMPLTLNFLPETKIQGIFLGNSQQMASPINGEFFEGVLPPYSVVPLTAYLQNSHLIQNKISQEMSDNARSASELA
jgi:hypothetical protein